MPLKFLRAHARELTPPRLRCNGVGFICHPQESENEALLAFQIDDPAFRDKFGVNDQQLCDAVVCCVRNNEKPVVIWIELKGSEIDKAVRQIASTHRAISGTERCFADRCHGLVITSGASPQKQNDANKAAAKSGIRFHFKHICRGINYNLRDDPELLHSPRG